MTTPIRLAIVGAGIFATESYLPALNRLEDRFKIVAVCSRSENSVNTLASHIPYNVDRLTDYNALLAREDIDAVSLVVPIGVMAGMIEAALAAGKHVISEKPAAADVASGRRLLALPRRSVWMVAENWRYGQALQQAAQLIQSGAIGKPITVAWNQHLDARSGKYFHTGWRTDNSFPGGFILDGGVHHVAGLRLLLGEINTVSAFGAQVYPDMPPLETLSASLRFDNGCIGAYTVTYASGSPYERGITVVGDKGSFIVRFEDLDLAGVRNPDEHIQQKFKDDTIFAELADFADAIQSGKTPQSTPEDAVQDVAVVEAMVRAADTGSVVSVERIVR